MVLFKVPCNQLPSRIDQEFKKEIISFFKIFFLSFDSQSQALAISQPSLHTCSYYS